MSVFTIEVLLAIAGMVLLLAEAFFPKLPLKIFGIAAIGSAIAALLLFLSSSKETASLPGFVAAWHQLDSLAIFYKGFALVTTILVVWLLLICAPYLKRFSVDGKLGEMLALPLIVCAGMMWMASAKDLVTVFVSLELVTVSFYVLVACTRKSVISLEAGVKYLILGALSTGILVFGIAWIYGATGSLSFEGIAKACADGTSNKTALLFATAFLLAGMGFKVAMAPFQMWVPDVYQGASIPVTTFLSVGSKAAGFIVLTRLINALTASGSMIRNEVILMLVALGAVTILVGSLPAIYQTSVKRMLAYSSISHAGFLVLALACRDSVRFDLSAGGVVAFYLATYLPMTVLGFLGLAIMRLQGRGEELQDFTGLAKRSPLLATMLTIAFASLAGLPLTGGFLGKMFVFVGMVDQGWWIAIACAVVGAAAGFYYYFRIILAMFSPLPADEASGPLNWTLSARVLSIALGLLILILGVYPRPLQKLLAPAPVAATHQVAPTR